MSEALRAITGIRPTGDLTVANYLGAMRPITDMQTTYDGEINAFVADLHALTDQEPEVVERTRLDTVRSYLAAGVDPRQVNLYLQSQVGADTIELASLLDRHVTISELMRVPTLKDKLRDGQRAETVTVALARYPILMAADIFVQDATHVPVGKDQYPHIEFARELARKFNNEYGQDGSVIVTPAVLASEGIKIVSLDGKGKMSKSSPRGAIFLNDGREDVEAKLKRAQTSNVGETSEALESHLRLGLELASSDEERESLERFYREHMDGQQVMGSFKGLLGTVIADFLEDYQERFSSISDAEVKSVLDTGGEVAREQVSGVLHRAKQAMGITV